MEKLIILALFALAAFIVISRIRKTLKAFSRDEKTGYNPCSACAKSCASCQKNDTI